MDSSTVAVYITPACVTARALAVDTDSVTVFDCLFTELSAIDPATGGATPHWQTKLKSVTGVPPTIPSVN